MRTFPVRLRHATAALLLAWFGVIHASPVAAALVPSRVTGHTAVASVRDADLLVVQRALENRVVAQKLSDYGVSTDEVKIRVASMSDQDVHTLATASAGLPSGGDGFGTLISLLIVVLLVVLILKLLDKKIVVK